MISTKLFKIMAKVRNPSLFRGVTVVQSRPKSHTFTVILAPAKMASLTVERSINLKLKPTNAIRFTLDFSTIHYTR